MRKVVLIFLNVFNDKKKRKMANQSNLVYIKLKENMT